MRADRWGDMVESAVDWRTSGLRGAGYRGWIVLRKYRRVVLGGWDAENRTMVNAEIAPTSTAVATQG